MNSRQLMRWLIAKLTPMLNKVSKTTGRTQLGFRTMSSNVGVGEKKTPMIRPNGLIAGCDCASGAGRDVVVAIEVPPPQDALLQACSYRLLPLLTSEHQRKFHFYVAQASSTGVLFGAQWSVRPRSAISGQPLGPWRSSPAAAIHRKVDEETVRP